jgi:hypothetical protein
LVPVVAAEDLAATYRRGGVEVTLRRSHLGEHVLYHRLAVIGVLRYLASQLANPPDPGGTSMPGPPNVDAAPA